MTNEMDKKPDGMEAGILAHLSPLLPGARLTGPFPAQARPSFNVIHDTGHRLEVYASPGLSRYFIFDRTVPFSNEERSLCGGIVNKIQNGVVSGKRYEPSLAARAVSEAVANYAAPEAAETVWQVIQLYESWAEPKSTHTIGVHLTRPRPARNSLFDLRDKGLLKVLGSSPDTLLGLDSSGGLIGVEKTPWPGPVGQNKKDVLAPIACANIAAWANSQRKVAVRLTDDGQILLFSNKQLLFVKRNSHWYSLPHTLINLEPIPGTIEGVASDTVKALYLTALDMAMGRGFITIELWRSPKNKSSTASKKASSNLGTPNGLKNAKLLAALTKAKRFPEMPRPIRAEICALGGALFLDGEGTILGLDNSGGNQNRRAGRHDRGEAGKVFSGSGFMEIINTGRRFNLVLRIR